MLYYFYCKPNIQFKVKETHYGSKQKTNTWFHTEHPELKNKVKYQFYYSYSREKFNFLFGWPQVDICSQCENFSAKPRDPCLSVNTKCNTAAE